MSGTETARTKTPAQSLRALLENLIDYAGLFPPAKLDMATTVRNYASYLACDESWMLGRIIIPVAKLKEFEQTATPLWNEHDDPWQISALVSEADLPQLEADIAAIEAFNLAHEDSRNALIDVVELKATSTQAIEHALELMPDDLFPYFEIPVSNDPRGLIASLSGADAGAKIRTGGVTADLYPPPHDLARFIAACAAADVPFKATAGMHHPLRHYSEPVKTHEFGFFNVFVAACLAHTSTLDVGTLSTILEDESPKSFSFTDDAVEWSGHRVHTSDLTDARESFAVSFGSCSFDEPRDDLRQLKLL